MERENVVVPVSCKVTSACPKRAICRSVHLPINVAGSTYAPDVSVVLPPDMKFENVALIKFASNFPKALS